MHLKTLTLLFLVILLSACGGGSGDGTTASSDPNAATIGVVITDHPSAEFDAAIATISSITLICEMGDQTIFEGSATFDLLQLTDFVELLTDRRRRRRPTRATRSV